MAKAIHSMIRVRDEDAAVAFYETAFDLTVADRYDMDGFTLVYLSNPKSDFELELTVNEDREEPYDLGDGYGHLAVSVTDLEAARESAIGAGAEPGEIKTISKDDTLIGRFFFVKDPDGYQIEVLAREGRFA